MMKCNESPHTYTICCGFETSHWFCHFFRLSPNVYKSPFPVWLSIDKLAARYRRDFLENVLKIWHEFKEICGRINKLDGMKDN